MTRDEINFAFDTKAATVGYGAYKSYRLLQRQFYSETDFSTPGFFRTTSWDLFT